MSRDERRGRAGLAVLLCLWSCTAGATQPATRPPPTAATANSQRGSAATGGVLRCGSVERPGIAELGTDGMPRGLAVDVCRAVAIAAQGPAARIEYSFYVSPADFDRVRRHVDDVYFLTGREIAVEKLAGVLLPGPTVYVASDAVMVPGNSSAAHVADLAGRGVCFLIGDTAERSLEAVFESTHADWLRHPYSETGEMADAYAVQRCQALAGESTELARITRLDGPARLASRLLPEPIDVFPLIAATPVGDGRLSALVAWTVATLIDAERPETKWFAGGVRAMPLPGGELGLPAGWQARVVQAVGHYGDIFRRNLGAASGYGLDRGLNAEPAAGGLLLAPFVE